MTTINEYVFLRDYSAQNPCIASTITCAFWVQIREYSRLLTQICRDRSV